MSKTRIICHIVFATKAREKSINPEYKRDLYKYIYGIIKNHKCFTKRINGMSDHVHILLDLSPSIALSDLMEKIKSSSSLWLKSNPNFKKFKGWGRGYYAESIGREGEAACYTYICNQEVHHKDHSLSEELEYLIKSIGMEWYPDELG